MLFERLFARGFVQATSRFCKARSTLLWIRVRLVSEGITLSNTAFSLGLHCGLANRTAPTYARILLAGDVLVWGGRQRMLEHCVREVLSRVYTQICSYTFTRNKYFTYGHIYDLVLILVLFVRMCVFSVLITPSHFSATLSGILKCKRFCAGYCLIL